MEKVIARTWEEVAEKIKERAEAIEGASELIVRLVEMDVETADGGNVHDVYEGVIGYHAFEDLNGEELVRTIRERYSRDERYLKEYKTECGVKNFVKRSEEIPYVEGIIIQ